MRLDEIVRWVTLNPLAAILIGLDRIIDTKKKPPPIMIHIPAHCIQILDLPGLRGRKDLLDGDAGHDLLIFFDLDKELVQPLPISGVIPDQK